MSETTRKYCRNRKRKTEKKNDSIWHLEDVKSYPTLNTNLEAEVAVIGGGMTGILTAYQLQQHGMDVIVLEADRIGQGVTRNTTAKITSQHNLIYRDLIEDYGFEKAREYAMSQQAAVEQFEHIIRTNQIDCDYREEIAYVYSINHPERIVEEVEASLQLGLPAFFTKETALPFEVAGAEGFEHQASFHPLKFLYEIANDMEIYEQSRVLRILGDNELEVENGAGQICHVQAKNIVVATHYPFANFPGFYFTKMHQERSYVVAMKAPEALPFGMYISMGNTGYSFRKYKDYVLIGGGNHRTGQNYEKEHFKPIIQAAKRFYPQGEIVRWWGNQDCMPIDGVPYIGTYAAREKNIFVATGYNKWGMTNSMVAAMNLNNMILGAEEKENSIYYPRRFNLQASKKKLKMDIKITTKRLTLQQIYKPKTTIKDLKPGYGGIVLWNGKKVGAYRTKKGVVYLVTTKCPHLGCMLEWNQEERSWDCPCHGSRFDYRGRLINGPAQVNLKNPKKE